MKRYKESKEIKERIDRAVSQVRSEDMIRHYASELFGKEFILSPTGQTGFDVISKDKTIKIEVKSTSALQAPKTLRIKSLNIKRDKCTHIAVVDFYKSYEHPRISIIPHDEFFASNVTAGNKNSGIWNWDCEYGSKNTARGPRQEQNTKLFLKHEVKL